MHGIMGCLVALAAASGAMGQIEHLRISQSYSTGGLLPNGPNADYVELYNDGDTTVPLTGMSVQATSPRQAAWSVVPLFGAIQPHGYFLIRVSAPRTTGWPIVADVNAAAPADAMYEYGKVALVDGLSPLVGRPECPMPASVVDFVGYGGTRLPPYGGDQRLPCGPTEDVTHNAPYSVGFDPTLRVFAVYRKCGGAANTGDNASDFYLADPAPRNSMSPANTGATPDGVVRFPATSTQAGTSIQVRVDGLTWCAGELTSVVADLSAMGGPVSIVLSPQSADVYTGALSIPLGAIPGDYQIPVRMTDSNGRTGTRYGVLRVLGPIPNNDLCSADAGEQAPYLLTLGVPVSGDTTSATSINDGPNPCQMTPRNAAVWYYFVAPETREYQVTFCTGMGYSDVGLVANVFQTTDCEHFTLVACGYTNCISSRSGILDAKPFMVAGQRYAIRITKTSGVAGLPFQLKVIANIVTGDACERWYGLNTDNSGFGTFTGTTQGTAEALDHPPFACAPTGVVHDFYYVFSFEHYSGMLTIDSAGSEIDTVLEATGELGSSGCTFNTPMVVCNDDAGIAGDPTASRITLPMQSRTVLRVGQKAAAGTPGGTFKLNFTSQSTPENETCNDAFRVFVTSTGELQRGYRANNNAVVALDSNAPPLACAPSATRDLFWMFYPTQTGVWDVSLCNDSPHAFVIQVFTGCGPGATVLGCSDDQARCEVGGGPRVRFNATLNTVYYVRIASKDGIGGPIRAAIELARPVNDDCAGATVLELNTPVTVDDTFATSRSTGFVGNYECSPNYFPTAGRDVFFTFTPPATAAYDFSTCELGDHTVITVHSECPITYENTLACSSYPRSGTGPCGGTSSAAKISGVVLLADHTYYVRCGTNSASTWILRATSQLPLGACRIGGLCVPTDQPRCNGLWTAGPVCPRSPDATVGACCTGSICVLAAAASCSGIGLRFVGAGTVCNAPGDWTTPCCAADFNQNGQVSVQDIFDFVGAFFDGDGRADVNASVSVSVQDIFDYLVSYFGGCL